MMFLKLNFCSILQGCDTEQKSNSMSIHQMKKKVVMISETGQKLFHFHQLLCEAP